MLNFRLSATALFLLQEQLQKGSIYLVKMSFGVEESVLVQYVMEHLPCLKGKFLPWLEEVIQLQRKQYT